MGTLTTKYHECKQTVKLFNLIQKLQCVSSLIKQHYWRKSSLQIYHLTLKMKIFLLAGCFFLTCTGAPHPQYGGVQPPQSEHPGLPSHALQPVSNVRPQQPPRRSEPHTLPVQASSVRCHVEAVTVWDVVYTETVNNVCNTEYEEECTTACRSQCQTSTRRECNNVLEEVCTTNTRKECH